MRLTVDKNDSPQEKDNPLILVTNDDGIHSPGIHALSESLEDLGECWMIAPDRERSAVGHSFTMNHPIRAKQIKPRQVITDGTPTDCVMFGVLGYLERKPDLVVSGINLGPNLGDDVTYSGTVAAALEGVMLGLPAMAISMNYPQKQGNSYSDEYKFDTAAKIARILVEQLLALDLPQGVFLNVNVPNCEYDQLNGIELTRLGKRIYQDRVIRRIDPHGKDYFWIGGEEPSWQVEEGTDFQAIVDKKVSITPISFDLTEYKVLQTLQEWGKKLNQDFEK